MVMSFQAVAFLPFHQLMGKECLAANKFIPIFSCFLVLTWCAIFSPSSDPWIPCGSIIYIDGHLLLCLGKLCMCLYMWITSWKQICHNFNAIWQESISTGPRNNTKISISQYHWYIFRHARNIDLSAPFSAKCLGELATELCGVPIYRSDFPCEILDPLFICLKV